MRTASLQTLSSRSELGARGHEKGLGESGRASCLVVLTSVFPLEIAYITHYGSPLLPVTSWWAFLHAFADL